MKTLINKKTCKVMSFALALTAFAFTAQGQTTVGALNPNPPSAGIVDSLANAANANFVTQASMATIVSSAFIGNTGGVINWQAANGWVANLSNTVETVSYGNSQGNSLTITRNDGANYFGASIGGGTTGTSGAQYLAFNGTGSPVDLTFSYGLLYWGMAIVDRSATRTAQLTFTLADSTTITYATDTQTSGGPAIWFGVQASSSDPIVGVTLTASGFTRWGDMAFVVAPVPEPTTLTLLGFGALTGIVAFRRRSR